MAVVERGVKISVLASEILLSDGTKVIGCGVRMGGVGVVQIRLL